MIIRKVSILCFLLLTFNVYGQVPWQVVPTSVSQVIALPVDAMYFEGSILQDGDAIGVFYDSLGIEACAGFVIFETSLSELNLIAYGAESGMDNGLQPGESLLLRYWNLALDCQVDSVATEFVEGNSEVFKPGENTSIAAMNGNYGQVIYEKQSFCQNELNPKPIISGIGAIRFTSGNDELIIDEETGEIDLAASQPGEYTILYESEACTRTNGIVVQIQQEQPLLLQGNLSICPSAELNISAQDGFNNYLWSNGQQSSDITVDEPGTYWVETVIGACVIRDSVVVVSSELVFEDVSVGIVDEQCDAGGSLIVENVVGQEPFRYILTNNFNQSQLISLNGIFDGLTEGSYMLAVSDRNNCEAIYNENITIGKNADCKYQVISPDNDGIGDTYFIEQSGSAKIYDRSGKLRNTFSTPYSWDGSDSSSRPLPMGIYLIVINDNKQIQVTIVR